jgi:hypothetical protein
MVAVLHAQYSYSHICELDIRIAGTPDDSLPRREICDLSISLIVPKLEFGISVLRQADLTHDGQLFFEAMIQWSNDICRRGTELLEQFSVPLRPFKHPLL